MLIAKTRGGSLKINGREVPGPIVDFGVLMYHCGRIMADVESGPFFYLSKVENALEARLWDQIFTWAENQLGLKFGTIRIKFCIYFFYDVWRAPCHRLPSA